MLFGWVLLTDIIPHRNSSTGFVLQVYDVADAVGSGSTVAALAVLAYVIGILGVTLGDALRSATALIESRFISVGEWLRWQGHARRTRDLQRRQLETARTRFETAKGSTSEQGAKQALDQAIAPLETIGRNSALWGLWIRRTPEIRRQMGSRSPAGLTVETLAETAIGNAWEKGVDDELRRRDFDVASSEIRERPYQFEEQLLEQDLGHDPLDALRALDQLLYQAFDRERSEREFRIAVMPPLFATTIYVGLSVTPWAYVGAGLCVVTFLVAAVRQSQETARVLNQVVLKGLSLPSLRAAELAGHDAVRQHRSKQAAKRATPSAAEILGS